MIKKDHIDHGKAFDWGKTSEYYAKYRDIYPPEFYQEILNAGLCTQGQQVLDLGTGTGVLPRSLYSHGATFTGTDISSNQIAEAKLLSQQAGMNITYLVSPAEEVNFPDNSFDVITACQCFFYFDPERIFSKLFHLLKPGGKAAILYMGWLPEEYDILQKSEALVLKYNPDWTGGGDYRHPISFPEQGQPYFSVEDSHVFDLQVPFTRDTWHGRIRSCRGIGASSLSQEQIQAFEKEHRAMLEQCAPENFRLPHYGAMLVLKSKKEE